MNGSAANVLDVPPAGTRATTTLAAAGAVVLHLALVALASLGAGQGVRPPAGRAVVTQMVEIALPREAPPEPTPEPVRQEPAAAPMPSRVRSVKRVREVKEAPPPAAARAAQVLTAPEQASEPNTTTETIVTGSSQNFAGGVTEAGGTAAYAVRDERARAGGVEGGTGTNLTGDRSRAPQLAGGAVWDCPFPEEAEDAMIDDAVVTLRVSVASDGRVLEASASKDPGYGFGREARRCALRKRWAPGLDRAGNAIGAVATVNVRFVR